MSKKPKGFTLIELLVVLGIISILFAIALPNVFIALQRAKVTRAKADLKAIATAIEMYRLDYGFVPYKSGIVPIETIPELPRYVQTSTVDSWGEFLYYYSDGEGEHYFIASKGTDRSWDGFSGPPNWDTPKNFKGTKCQHVSFDDSDALVTRGCDIKYIDGAPLY
jgi:general secretion pathway protein G